MKKNRSYQRRAKKGWRTIRNNAIQAKVDRSTKESFRHAKVALHNNDYRCLDFRNKNGRERADGVVDLVAITKLGKDHNLLKILFFQVKGGSKKVKPEELQALRQVKKRAKIYWGTAEKPGKSVIFKDENRQELQF